MTRAVRLASWAGKGRTLTLTRTLTKVREGLHIEDIMLVDSPGAAGGLGSRHARPPAAPHRPPHPPPRRPPCTTLPRAPHQV